MRPAFTAGAILIFLSTAAGPSLIAKADAQEQGCQQTTQSVAIDINTRLGGYVSRIQEAQINEVLRWPGFSG